MNELLTVRNAGIFCVCILASVVVLVVLVEFTNAPEGIQTGIPAFIGFGLPWILITILDREKWQPEE